MKTAVFIVFIILVGTIGACSASNQPSSNIEETRSSIIASNSFTKSNAPSFSSIDDCCNSSDINNYGSNHQINSDDNDFISLDLTKASFEEWWETEGNYQDGCIYNDVLFLFSSNGLCTIFNISNKQMICSSQLPTYKGYCPHSNSVSFGKKFCDTDTYPLLYSNIYNNYPNIADSFGMCLVYRIIDETLFEFKLMQVIKIGFTNDANLWYDNSDNASPYGNFLICGDDLWVYVNIFGSSITRFFSFKTPAIIVSDDIDFCILTKDNIQEMFDTDLFKYIQGGTSRGTNLVSLEGFGTELSPSFLRIISLTTKTIQSIDLGFYLNTLEPEFVSFYNNLLIVGTYEGKFFSSLMC